MKYVTSVTYFQGPCNEDLHYVEATTVVISRV
jgi:hypothetical protein